MSFIEEVVCHGVFLQGYVALLYIFVCNCVTS